MLQTSSQEQANCVHAVSFKRAPVCACEPAVVGVEPTPEDFVHPIEVKSEAVNF